MGLSFCFAKLFSPALGNWLHLRSLRAACPAQAPSASSTEL